MIRMLLVVGIIDIDHVAVFGYYIDCFHSCILSTKTYVVSGEELDKRFRLAVQGNCHRPKTSNPMLVDMRIP